MGKQLKFILMLFDRGWSSRVQPSFPVFPVSKLLFLNFHCNDYLLYTELVTVLHYLL
jgi:hypothetical protein